MFGFLCDCCWISLFITLFILYFLINFLVDSSVSTKSRKNILVTGCDSGFGLATALDLNESNCKVFAGCLTRDGVDRLQNDSQFQGMAFIMDVTKDEDVENAKEIVKNNGGLDGLVNNAGITIDGLIEWITVGEMKKIFEVNYWGAVRVTKVMLPFLKKSRDGRIVNITSMAGRISIRYSSAYCSSKFALEAFSDSLRLELKPWGVSVHLIEPTLYRTQIVNLETRKTSWYRAWDNLPSETRENFSKNDFDDFLADGFKKLQCSENLGDVTEKIKHALLSFLPRRRYTTGNYANLLVLVSHLPTFISDLIMGRILPLLEPKAKKN